MIEGQSRVWMRWTEPSWNRKLPLFLWMGLKPLYAVQPPKTAPVESGIPSKSTSMVRLQEPLLLGL